VSFRVKLSLDTGHPDDEFSPGDSPNGGYGEYEFDTEAERDAFVRGIEIASEALDGWLDGSLNVEHI